MKNPPTGTVTLLFTAIEDSTNRREPAPEAMQKALARHDHILRQIIEAHGGYIFKTDDHAFRAAFATARDATTEPQALEAAISAQRALKTEGWGEVGELQVRMALHTGAVEMRNNGYAGPEVDHVARLLSAGVPGGAILLSTSATTDLVRDQEPPGVIFHHLHHAWSGLCLLTLTPGAADVPYFEEELEREALLLGTTATLKGFEVTLPRDQHTTYWWGDVGKDLELTSEHEELRIFATIATPSAALPFAPPDEQLAKLMITNRPASEVQRVEYDNLSGWTLRQFYKRVANDSFVHGVYIAHKQDEAQEGSSMLIEVCLFGETEDPQDWMRIVGTYADKIIATLNPLES